MLAVDAFEADGFSTLPANDIRVWFLPILFRVRPRDSVGSPIPLRVSLPWVGSAMNERDFASVV
jgi:hypothetical protein